MEQYQIVSSSDLQKVQDRMNELALRGYRVVQFVHSPPYTTGELAGERMMSNAFTVVMELDEGMLPEGAS